MPCESNPSFCSRTGLVTRRLLRKELSQLLKTHDRVRLNFKMIQKDAAEQVQHFGRRIHIKDEHWAASISGNPPEFQLARVHDFLDLLPHLLANACDLRDGGNGLERLNLDKDPHCHLTHKSATWAGICVTRAKLAKIC